MKSVHLHDLWASPDNSRLVSKQISLRLPVHIAAKIAALNEIYPQKNRTQIIADLLTVAFEDLEKNLPFEIELADEETQKDHAHENYMQGIEEVDPVYTMSGIRARFRYVSNRHYLELEKELGNENADQLFQVPVGSYEYVKNSV